MLITNNKKNTSRLLFSRLQKLRITANLDCECACLCIFCVQLVGQALPRAKGADVELSLALSCGEEGVKRYERLPGNVVAAEKESLQAGQAVHLSLERERERGRGRRE